MYNSVIICTTVAALEIKCFLKKLKQNCAVYEIHRWLCESKTKCVSLPSNVWELRSLLQIITTIIYIYIYILMQTVDNTYLD